MMSITPRLLLGQLPWVQVNGGIYRVNRTKVELPKAERIAVDVSGSCVNFAPESLRSVPLFSRMPDAIVAGMTHRFRTEEVSLGNEVIVEGEDRREFFIIAQGQVEVLSKGAHGSNLRIALLTEGEFFGETDLVSDKPSDVTIRTITPCILLTLSRKDLDAVLGELPGLGDDFKKAIAEHLELQSAVNRYGERNIDLVSGFAENVEIPETFVDYSATPREYSLSAVQTVVRVRTRVSDLYNDPYNQLEEQMRLTIEGIKERQEWELINSKKFGLIHSVDPAMRISTRYGAPTPDDLDELLALVWKKPAFFVAHPKAIAAFERECTWRGVPPVTTHIAGMPVIMWRGVPLIPCDKLEVKGRYQSNQWYGTTSILLLRVGETDQGVVGFHQSGVRGEIMLEAYESLLGPRTRLVALTQASNSLGTILPVAEMTRMARRYNARVLVDGAQTVAHMPVNLEQLDCDFFVFSGHKIFAPTGIGVVYAKKELWEIMPPWQSGGNMIRSVTFEETTFAEPPAKFEAGTPNVADAVGLRAAVEYVERLGLPNIARYEHELLQHATELLSRIPGLRLIGTAREKVGVLSFVLKDRRPDEVGRLLDQQGIAVRSGHHCAQPSLRRFGLEATVRPSLAFYNTREEVDRLADAVRRIQHA
jgi:cysteine sulfinate desulfinase/cysteine desulfurase-like protein